MRKQALCLCTISVLACISGRNAPPQGRRDTIDSARAVSLAVETLSHEDWGKAKARIQFVVQGFSADSAGFVVSLFPEAPGYDIVGGGAVLRVLRDGRVTVLERYR
jgi:hypothetical protein